MIGEYTGCLVGSDRQMVIGNVVLNGCHKLGVVMKKNEILRIACCGCVFPFFADWVHF
jgi:hypothetical protein